MSVDRPEDDPEVLREAALAMACPRCGVPVSVSCKWYGRFGSAMHPERLSAASGGPGKLPREHVWWRMQYGQGRMDPTVTVRYLQDDEAA